MTEILDRIHYREYTIEVLPDYDAENPLGEDQFAPSLVLHENAERHFGWTNDPDWQTRLNVALVQLASSRATTELYGPSGALSVIHRWMKMVWQIPLVLPISALDHSGVTVYIGAGEHWADPGGWDSGWIGWLFATPERIREWGFDPVTDLEMVEKNLLASFGEFAAWVSGDVIGYRIIDLASTEIHSSFGYYGSAGFREPDGDLLVEAKAIIDADIADKEVLR